MILFPDFEDFIKLLNTHSVNYMVVGGYALAFHGKPRNTGDLDIWIEISESNAKKLLQVLDDFGFGDLNFKKEDFTKPGYLTQIGYPPLRIDILNNIDGVEFNPDYALGFVMRLVIAIKSGCLETESSRTYGMVKSKTAMQ